MPSLWRDLKEVLEERNFSCSQRCRAFPRSVDLAARGEGKLILNISVNVDTVSKESAEKMRSAAKVIGAEPIIIGMKGHKPLSNSAFYERYMVKTLTPSALGHYLDGEPLCKAERGGFTMRVEGIGLRRKERGLSRGKLADLVGVSVTMIKKYEKGASPSPEKAERLASILGERIFPNPSKETEQFRMAGFETAELNCAPFDFALRSSSLLFVSKESSPERINSLRSFAQTLDAEPILLKGRSEDVRTMELQDILECY